MQILAVIKKHGYRLEDVASMLGITKGSLSAAVNGSPNVKRLIEIAQKIGCSPAEFFDDWYENEGKEQKREDERGKMEDGRGKMEDAAPSPADDLPFKDEEPKQESMPGVVICPHCKGRFVAEIIFKSAE